MVSEREDAIARINNERIEGYAEQISLYLQCVTGMSDGARSDVKDLLIQFAEEIKRQAIEP